LKKQEKARFTDNICRNSSIRLQYSLFFANIAVIM
jgi:hypothetical protein